MSRWEKINRRLSDIESKQVFFVGGAPRSGTTWLQQILNSHPEVCCQGEGFFMKHLLDPVETIMLDRAKLLDTKNKSIFSHTGGYPVPTREMTDHIVVTAILYSLAQQTRGQNFRAIGEKTPENVFLFQRLTDLLPSAKLIAIARDPRDVLTSAWHFFQDTGAGAEVDMEAFLRQSFGSLNSGAKTMIKLSQCLPDRYLGVTYETLLREPKTTMTRIFRHIGIELGSDVLDEIIETTTFAAMSSGQATGDGAFFRSGSIGSWKSTVTSQMNELILAELGWMFRHFDWSVN